MDSLQGVRQAKSRPAAKFGLSAQRRHQVARLVEYLTRFYPRPNLLASWSKETRPSYEVRSLATPRPQLGCLAMQASFPHGTGRILPFPSAAERTRSEHQVHQTPV